MSDKFKVGDRIKLGDYTHYGDHVRRKDQPATIVDTHENGNFRIQWDDGGYSVIFKETNFQGAYLINKGVEMQKEYKVGEKIDLSQVLVKITNEDHKEYAKGAKFVYLGDGTNASERKGQVVELKNNDGTSNPWFITSWDRGAIISWKFLAELPEGKAGKAQKPTVTSTMTVYSDGVEVNETELRFDGQTFTRDALKEKVARYQEILRRPIAVVPEAKKVVKKAAPKKALKKVEIK